MVKKRIWNCYWDGGDGEPTEMNGYEYLQGLNYRLVFMVFWDG